MSIMNLRRKLEQMDNRAADGQDLSLERIDLTVKTITPQSILSSGPTSGIGYSTGAGGAVTQGTGSANFATGVTLSKVCGRITTATAADATQTLAAGVEAEFTVTNTVVAATDVVIASVATNFAGTGGFVSVYVKSTAAGSFVLGMTNLSTAAINSTLSSGAAIINFAVIKAVNA